MSALYCTLMLYYVPLCISIHVFVSFSLTTDCTSSLGRHRCLAQGTLLLCKKSCVNFQVKSEKKCLPEIELIA